MRRARNCVVDINAIVIVILRESGLERWLKPEESIGIQARARLGERILTPTSISLSQGEFVINTPHLEVDHLLSN